VIPFVLPSGLTVLFALLAVWELCWKGFALWKAGKHDQLYWFIAILIVNSAGILPIVYIFFFQKKKSRK